MKDNQNAFQRFFPLSTQNRKTVGFSLGTEKKEKKIQMIFAKTEDSQDQLVSFPFF